MPVTLLSLYDIMSNAVWTMMAVSMPILMVAMVVGLLIGILQTATSIQEQTLIFIPKILAVFLSMVLLGPWMGARMLVMTREILGQGTETERNDNFQAGSQQPASVLGALVEVRASLQRDERDDSHERRPETQ